MIIIRLIFTLFLIGMVLVVFLGLSLWFKIKLHLQNPFLRERDESPLRRDDNVIEGEYKVLDESHKD